MKSLLHTVVLPSPASTSFNHFRDGCRTVESNLSRGLSFTTSVHGSRDRGRRCARSFISSTRTASSRGVLLCRAQLNSDVATVTSAAYGLLLLGGGLFAFTRSGSKGSLIGGFTGATLMGTAYYLMQMPETRELGDALAFGSALLFASVFGIRAVASKKLFPAGALLGVSVAAMAVYLSAYLQDKL